MANTGKDWIRVLFVSCFPIFLKKGSDKEKRTWDIQGDWRQTLIVTKTQSRLHPETTSPSPKLYPNFWITKRNILLVTRRKQDTGNGYVNSSSNVSACRDQLFSFITLPPVSPPWYEYKLFPFIIQKLEKLSQNSVEIVSFQRPELYVPISLYKKKRWLSCSHFASSIKTYPYL